LSICTSHAGHETVAGGWTPVGVDDDAAADADEDEPPTDGVASVEFDAAPDGLAEPEDRVVVSIQVMCNHDSLRRVGAVAAAG
jgi:hypothetical protein